MMPLNQEPHRSPNRPRRLTKPQRAFLAAYAKTGNLLLAARLGGKSRGIHDRWLAREQAIAKLRDEPVDEYPYHAAYAAAHEDAVQQLEAEARRRAERGVKKLKYYQGKPLIDPETGEPCYELEFDTTLLMFLLKSLRPERYRDRAEPRGGARAETSIARKAILYIPHNGRDLPEGEQQPRPLETSPNRLLPTNS